MGTHTAAAEVPAGYMRDSAGRLVPLANVKPEHLLEDQLVRELDNDARALNEMLAQFKARAFEKVDILLDLLAQKHGAKVGGAKGNVTLVSYDGALRVQVAIGDHLAFGPELQVAKSLVDECLDAWSQGANPHIRTVVNDAFDVGKEGKLVVGRILGLRRLNIDDEKWLRAMEAISSAIRVEQSRRYVRFYRRVQHDAPYVQVPLDVARA